MCSYGVGLEMLVAWCLRLYYCHSTQVSWPTPNCLQRTKNCASESQWIFSLAILSGLSCRDRSVAGCGASLVSAGGSSSWSYLSICLKCHYQQVRHAAAASELFHFYWQLHSFISVFSSDLSHCVESLHCRHWHTSRRLCCRRWWWPRQCCGCLPLWSCPSLTESARLTSTTYSSCQRYSSNSFANSLHFDFHCQRSC